MKAALLGLCCVLCLGTVALGDTVTYDAARVLGPTNWADSLSFPKFDATLGTLNSITCKLDGHVEGSAGFESKDAGPTTVSMDLSAILRLKRPDLSVLVVTIPVTSTMDNATAWDGVDDFSGTSGKTYATLSADQSESATSSSAADKALFTGVGNITLPVTANGASTGSGAGNLLLQFATSASAHGWVTYDYTLVPEPCSFVLLASCALGLIGWAWKRRALR